MSGSTGFGHSLSQLRRQVIAWSSGDVFSIKTVETNESEILSKCINLLMKRHLKILSVKIAVILVRSQYVVHDSSPEASCSSSAVRSSGVKSLCPSAAIWQYRSALTETQVMACCLMVSSYYPNQCWLPITVVLRMHLRAIPGCDHEFNP